MATYLQQCVRTWALILLFLVLPTAQSAAAFDIDEAFRSDRDAVRELQANLNTLGFSAGSPDGVFGARTQNAIEAFVQRWGAGPARLDASIADRVERISASLTTPPDRASFVPGPFPLRTRATYRSDIRQLCEQCNVANRILAAGDLDGDGIDEIVIGAEVQSLNWNALDQAAPIQILDAQGEPWARLDGQMPLANHLREAVIDDFNGDGLGDLFIAAHGLDAQPFPGAPNILLLSGPESHVDVSQTHIPTHDDMAHGVTGGDLDGDGDIDLFVMTNEGTENILPHVLLNDGQGRFTFSDASNHLDPALIDFNRRNRAHRAEYATARLEDYDGDGNIDLLFAARGEPNSDRASHAGSKFSLILYGNGTGRFGDERMLELPTDRWGLLTFTTDVDAADLDGDGDLDLALTLATRPSFAEIWQGQYIQILMNEEGSYIDRTAERLWPQGYERMEDLHYPGNSYLLDLSGDGQPELIVQNREPNWRDTAGDTAIMIGLNDGTGHFEPVNPGWLSEWQGYSGREITPADLDGDGIFELVSYRLVGVYNDGNDRTFGLQLDLHTSAR